MSATSGKCVHLGLLVIKLSDVVAHWQNNLNERMNE